MHIIPNANIDRNRIKYLLLIVSVWTAFGLFFGTQNYIRDTYAGRPASLPGYILGWIFCGYSWGILTVPVLRFVRRFSLERIGWQKLIAVHMPAAAVFSLFQLGIYLFIAGVIFRASGRGLWEFYKFLLANELQSSVLVYVAIVAAITIYDRFFSTDAKAVGASPFSVAEHTGNGHNGPSSQANRFLKRIPVKENGRIVLVDTDHIDWIESYGNYLFLHTPERKFIHRETMAGLEKKLDPGEFLRIRRSAIVRVDRIREFHPIDNGEFEVLLQNGTMLSSTRRYKKNLELIIKS